MDKLFYPENYETGVVVELYGLLREDFSGGRMREARAEIKAEFPSGNEDWKVNAGTFLDLTHVRCEVHWLQGKPQTQSLGSLQQRRLKLEWWHVLFAPAVGGLLVGVILKYLTPGGNAEGVAQVIEAGSLRGSKLTLRRGLAVATVSAWRRF